MENRTIREELRLFDGYDVSSSDLAHKVEGVFEALLNHLCDEQGIAYSPTFYAGRGFSPLILQLGDDRSFVIEFKVSAAPGRLPPSRYADILRNLESHGRRFANANWILITNYTLPTRVEDQLHQYGLTPFFFELDEPTAILQNRLRDFVLARLNSPPPKMEVPSDGS